jgi:hypothetical protein
MQVVPQKGKEMVLNRTWDTATLGKCNECSDWWSDVFVGERYPLTLGTDDYKKHAANPPPVKLSFTMMINGIESALKYYEEDKTKKEWEKKLNAIFIYTCSPGLRRRLLESNTGS